MALAQSAGKPVATGSSETCTTLVCATVRLSEFFAPPNGLAVQLRPTALTANAGARCPQPERYHGSIERSCWASSAAAC
jgi:hypothetical protein